MDPKTKREGSRPRRPGRPRKFGASQLFPLRLPLGLHGRIRAKADQEHRSINDLLLAAIQDWCRRSGVPVHLPDDDALDTRYDGSRRVGRRK